MAHGYVKATGRAAAGAVPQARSVLQHAAMAICNRLVRPRAGDGRSAATISTPRTRPPGVPDCPLGAGHRLPRLRARLHQVGRATPVSLPRFAESLVRAYKIAMTPPYGPVMISLDAGLQQAPVGPSNGEKLYIPKYTPTSPPAGEMGAVKEAAKMLAEAQNPVIAVSRAARTENGVRLLVQLAEALQARVIDTGERMNFPKMHHLSAGLPAVANADVILGMEMNDFWALVNQYVDNGSHGHGFNQQRMKAGTKLISDQRRRSQHQIELPGLPAFPGHRRADGGRCGSDAAGADRSG